MKYCLAGLAGAAVGVAVFALLIWLIIWSNGLFALVLGAFPVVAVGWGIGVDLWERFEP
jgi:hypothetical protein